jgi:hypothetical protein
MGIHLLQCVHSNERTKTHNVIHDTFAIIVQDVYFHLGWKQLHVLPPTTFNSFHWLIHTMFTKNGIRTLVDVVIVNSMWMDLLP